MALFDSAIETAAGKVGLSSEKAGGLLAALLGYITTNGFGGFLDRFHVAGLGDTVNSWITTGSNTPLSGEQLESALGEPEIASLADQAGVDRSTATSAMATMIPSVVDKLTPDGEIPDEASLIARIGGFLSDSSGATLGGLGAAGVYAGGASDRFGRINETSEIVADRVSGAVGNTGGNFNNDDDDNGGDSILKWLLPLIILGLLISLGASFCSKTPKTAAQTNNANADKSNIAVVINKNYGDGVDLSLI